MKKQISRALLGLTATLALAVVCGAQGLHNVVISVPFDFVAGAKQLPAGRYTVSRVRTDAETALIIRSEDGRTGAVVLTNRGAANLNAAAEFVFRQHGDRYFLAEVSIPGTASVRELPKSGTERRLERELAERKGGESKNVTVIGSVQ